MFYGYLTDLQWLNNAGIDGVFVGVDSLLRAGAFDSVNQILLTLPIEEIDTDLVLAFLTITAAARSLLPDRSHYFARAKELFIKRGEEDIEGLLVGLE